jgi:hypothetical protein
MSGIIAFSEKSAETWLVAGWAFRQIFEDIAAQESDDAEMMKEFELAKAFGGLRVYELVQPLRLRTTQAIRRVVSDILSGKMQSGINAKPYGDKRTIEQYQKALQELLTMMPIPE